MCHACIHVTLQVVLHPLLCLVFFCKKKTKTTSVSHSSTESEIISLDAGLCMDGILALDLWDKVLEVLRSANNTARHGKLAQGALCTTGDHSIDTRPKHELKRVCVRCSNCQKWITNPPTHILFKASLCCTFLKTMKP